MNFLKILVMIFLLQTKSLYASEDNLYKFLWLDPDKKVYVLQKKLFPKKMHVFFDIGGLYRFSNPFQTTFAPFGNIDFFFTEQLGISLLGGYYFNKDNNAFDGVKNKISQINQTATTNGGGTTVTTFKNLLPYLINFKYEVGGMVLFSPFYGKINTFNQIVYFDLYFGLGASWVAAQSNYDAIINDTAGDKTSQMKDVNFVAVNAKVGLRFYISKHVNFCVDYIHRGYMEKLITEDKIEKKGIYYESDIVAKFGISF